MVYTTLGHFNLGLNGYWGGGGRGREEGGRKERKGEGELARYERGGGWVVTTVTDIEISPIMFVYETRYPINKKSIDVLCQKNNTLFTPSQTSYICTDLGTQPAGSYAKTEVACL